MSSCRGTSELFCSLQQSVSVLSAQSHSWKAPSSSIDSEPSYSSMRTRPYTALLASTVIQEPVLSRYTIYRHPFTNGQHAAHGLAETGFRDLRRLAATHMTDFPIRL